MMMMFDLGVVAAASAAAVVVVERGEAQTAKTRGR